MEAAALYKLKEQLRHIQKENKHLSPVNTETDFEKKAPKGARQKSAGKNQHIDAERTDQGHEELVVDRTSFEDGHTWKEGTGLLQLIHQSRHGMDPTLNQVRSCSNGKGSPHAAGVGSGALDCPKDVPHRDVGPNEGIFTTNNEADYGAFQDIASVQNNH